MSLRAAIDRIHSTRLSYEDERSGESMVALAPADYATLFSAALRAADYETAGAAAAGLPSPCPLPPAGEGAPPRDSGGAGEGVTLGGGLALSQEAVSVPHSVPHRPAYYDGKNGISLSAVIDAFELNYWRGNVVKYLLRAGRKSEPLPDLLKARECLTREIARHGVVEEEEV